MRTIMRTLAIFYIVYLAIVVLVITPALNFLPSRIVQQTFGRQLHTEMVLFNPFTLALEVRQAELPELGGERFFAVDKAVVNLSLESLWAEGWVLDEVKVQGLYVHVIRLPEDKFNFSDMISDEPDEPAAEDTGGGIPGLTIHDFDFQSQTIIITDESRETPYSTHWDGLAIRVLDLSTVLEEGRPYSIDVYGEAGGSLHWKGEISVPNAYSKGHLVLKNLDLTTGWRFAEPWVQFELKNGRLNAEARYQLDWNDAFTYGLTDARLNLSAIDIAPKTTVELRDTALELQGFTIGGVTVDSKAQHATIDSVTVDGLALAGWSEGARVSLAELFAVKTSADPAGQEEEEPKPTAQEEDSDSGWTAEIKTTRLQNSSLRWRSEFTDPPVLEVAPFEATVDDVTWPLSGDSPLSLNIVANQQAKIAIDGVLALANGDGSIGYKLEGLPLIWFNPNLPTALKAQLTGGQVQVDGEVALAGYAPTTVHLSGAVTDFSGKMEEEETSLTSWDSVRWEVLEINLEQHSVAMKKLSIHKFSGRIHIAEDGSINAQNIWREEVGERAAEIAEDLSLDKPWTVSIPGIFITDSAVDFMDQSLPINFRTVIGDLNGEVLGIATEPGTVATVDIKGSVDGYAPVALKGSAQAFSTPPALDLSLTFDGVDLALLTPYSSTYAGYAIDRGLLTLHLQYALQNNQLVGDNRVLIDQLKLGDKVDSDQAADIPLKLGLALLTDANGVIDLQVPVSGNVDDPQFNVGSVIFKAFVNILTKAVTAPFSLLANLVGSEEDLQRMTFASGSAQLDEASKAKLGQLTSALTQRPELTVVLTGRLNIPADRESLQKVTLQEQLVAGGLPPEELDSKGPAWEKAIGARYESLPASSGQSADLSSHEMYQQVAQNIEVSDTRMMDLAQQRAVAVKGYLVNEAQLPADRAVVEKADLDDKANMFSGVELGMEN
ncbi:MAG: hypothetical protein DRR04_00180 [Gammaproteobacteria bacterium]|nr:MAG: hypothetical protein DRQ97_00605 [Gammaproteobacteria bacterium]RLA62422.1 MAG: hypothetical protein DRR04_00180 [Gammaproteobacteria bacterium]